MCGFIGIGQKRGENHGCLIHIVLFFLTVGIGNIIYLVYLNGAKPDVCRECGHQGTLPTYSPVGQDYIERFKTMGRYSANPVHPTPPSNPFDHFNYIDGKWVPKQNDQTDAKT